MKYSDGREIKRGDCVTLGQDGESGIVVCSIDSNEYSEEYPEAEWRYLKKGVMVNFTLLGLVHYAEPDSDLQLIARENG